MVRPYAPDECMKKYWPTIRDYLLILIAALVQALSLRLFFVPANLASGGVSGISQLINHFTGWPIGLMVLLGNIPLFALGWRFLGGYRFALRTAFAIFTYSTFTDLLVQTPFFAPNGAGTKLINDLQGDIFLNALYGAIVSGIGYGLVYRARGTSGGSDILARILNHYRGVPMTQSYLIVDTAVILGAGFVFGWKAALYAMIALYVSGLVCGDNPGRRRDGPHGDDRHQAKPRRSRNVCSRNWNAVSPSWKGPAPIRVQNVLFCIASSHAQKWQL